MHNRNHEDRVFHAAIVN